MTRTRSDLLTISARRILEQNRNNLNWTNVLRALNQALTPDREMIIGAIKNGNIREIGTLILAQINKVNQVDANAEAITILTDDNVSLIELDKIL